MNLYINKMKQDVTFPTILLISYSIRKKWVHDFQVGYEYSIMRNEDSDYWYHKTSDIGRKGFDMGIILTQRLYKDVY